MLFVEIWTLLLEPLADSPLAVFRVNLGGFWRGASASVHRRVVVTSVETVAQFGYSIVQFRMVVDFLAKGLLPGRVLQRFDEQIFDKDWVTVLKTVEVPQLQFIVGLGMHQIETVQKTVEVPQLPSRLGFVQFWTRSSIGSLAAVFPQCKLCRKLARSHRCCSGTWL